MKKTAITLLALCGLVAAQPVLMRLPLNAYRQTESQTLASQCTVLERGVVPTAKGADVFCLEGFSASVCRNDLDSAAVLACGAVMDEDWTAAHTLVVGGLKDSVVSTILRTYPAAE